MSHNNWIDDLMSEVTHVETPRSWIWWSLCSAISSVAANYHLRTLKGAVLYKPNIYVMLLGKSGLGKGFGVNLAKLLVQKADCTRVIAGRSSIQAILAEIGKQKSNANGKPPIKDSRCFVVNGELSSALIDDPDTLPILTDLYDAHYNPEWKNSLKTSASDTLKFPYVVTLFGTSLEHFYASIPAENIGGGYVARNLMVYEEKRFQNVNLIDNDEEGASDLIHDYIIPKYTPHLVKISEGGGRIRFNTYAMNMFNDWRHKWRETQADDKTGFLNRVPDHIVKTAMCLTLAGYECDYTINESIITEAITKVTNLVYANKMAASGKATEPMANHSKVVLDIILRSKDQTILRKLLLSRAYPFGLVEASVLDKVLDSLNEMGWITRERHGIGKNIDWVIKLAGEPLEGYKTWVNNQNVEQLRSMKTKGIN